MTALERTILALIVLDLEVLAEVDAKAAVGTMSGALADAIDRVRRNSMTPVESLANEYDMHREIEQVRPYDSKERRRLLLLNLSKWLHLRAVECQTFADLLDAQARGSASDCVAQMRRSKYRRGSAREID